MKTKPGPGNPEMGRRIADARADVLRVGRYAVQTRRIVYGFIALVTLAEVVRWLV